MNPSPSAHGNAYSITPEQVSSITDLDGAFGTVNLLPPMDQIPKAFFRINEYSRVVEAIFSGSDIPEGDIDFFEGYDPEAANRCIRAHLACYQPKHEHKIAGVSYMLSLMCTITLAHPKEGS